MACSSQAEISFPASRERLPVTTEQLLTGPLQATEKLIDIFGNATMTLVPVIVG